MKSKLKCDTNERSKASVYVCVSSGKQFLVAIQPSDVCLLVILELACGLDTETPQEKLTTQRSMPHLYFPLVFDEGLVVNTTLRHTHGGLHSMCFNRHAFIQAALQFPVHLHQDALESVERQRAGVFRAQKQCRFWFLTLFD